MDPGGLFIGTLEEFRIWNRARSAEDINLWKHRLLPTDPRPEGLVGLWAMEPGPPDEAYDHLTGEGWSQLEVFLAHFVNWYAFEYNQQSERILTDKARSYFSEIIETIIFTKAKDGYCAIYEPRYPEYLEAAGIYPSSGPKEGMLVYDRSDQTISEVIQSWTGNHLKVFTPTLGNEVQHAWALPPDMPEALDDTINPTLRKLEVELPHVAVSPKVKVENGIVTRVLPHRVRAIAPLIALPDGSLVRQFTWLFTDFWFGELTREQVHLPMTVRFLEADLQALQWALDLALPPQELVDDGPRKAIHALEQLLEDFQMLLETPNVDEVRDIQPFLADPRHWILLSPNRKHVWQQKMLGNRYKVDFLVQESDDSYVAIEIESPNFPLFTQRLDPYHKLTHAEQQVRDYCEFIDRNRDFVEREEGLPGIFRPRGVVVIGRRRSLSEDAARKLVARNRDAGRYTVMVYDDLMDRVQALLASIRAAMGP